MNRITLRAKRSHVKIVSGPALDLSIDGVTISRLVPERIDVQRAANSGGDGDDDGALRRSARRCCAGFGAAYGRDRGNCASAGQSPQRKPPRNGSQRDRESGSSIVARAAKCSAIRGYRSGPGTTLHRLSLPVPPPTAGDLNPFVSEHPRVGSAPADAAGATPFGVR